MVAKQDKAQSPHHDRHVLWSGTLVVLATMILIGFLVSLLGPTDPAVIAGVITAIAVPFGAVAAVIRALRGR